MANDIYEGAVTKTTAGSAAGVICAILPAALSATVRMPEIREIGIFNVSGAACEVGLLPGTTTGTTPSGGTTVINPGTGGAGNTQIIPTYATYPTVGSVYTRRAPLQAVAGAGIIWTWLPGEWALWIGASSYPFVIYQISAVNTQYDLYVKVAE
jgi:hypothetical protein